MKRVWLATARLEKDMRQNEVAEAAGIAPVTYCLIETGKAKPKPETAKRIANVLGVDWTKFYEEDV